MSFKVNRESYQRLLDEDLVWLKQQPRTLEREHIAMIVRNSVDVQYQSEERRNRLKELARPQGGVNMASTAAYQYAIFAENGDLTWEDAIIALAEYLATMCNSLQKRVEDLVALQPPAPIVLDRPAPSHKEVKDAIKTWIVNNRLRGDGYLEGTEAYCGYLADAVLAAVTGVPAETSLLSAEAAVLLEQGLADTERSKVTRVPKELLTRDVDKGDSDENG